MASVFSVRRRIVNKKTGAIKLEETRWGSYSSTLTCTQQEVAFLTLGGTQKMGNTIATQPVPEQGKHLEPRDCTGASLPDIFVTCTRDDFTPYTTPPPTTNYNSDGALGGHFVV
ncbi:hypothetical protein [Spirosoma aerolatum]|uniref:hypothetical protein n=1 Tax=Spirosoma aerolatum TaxID=1211326 RepID=UPI0009AD4A48|nr:hypothetical protein [Spirosoma aerolatum]